MRTFEVELIDEHGFSSSVFIDARDEEELEIIVEKDYPTSTISDIEEIEE